MIDVRAGVRASEGIQDVRAGRRDLAIMGYELDELDELARLRRRDPGLIRDTVQATTTWLFVNTRIAPFDSVDARRALSLAIDRRAVIAAAGGEDSLRASCHIIPPGLPGYRPDCPLGGPDLARARRLVARSGTRGARVTFWSRTPFDAATPPLLRALRSLGYRVSMRRLSLDEQAARVADSTTRAQIRPVTWGSDYPSTSTFLDQFSCRSFVRHSEANLNTSQFCDPRADGLMRWATAVQATDPRAADDLWARAERRVLAMVPAIPLFNLVHTDLVATRIRKDQYHPHWGLLLDQVSVR